MTPEREPFTDPPGQADAPMPAAVDPDPGTGDDPASKGDARIDDAVTQHSATPLERPDGDDLPPVPPGHPSDDRS